VRKHNHPLLQLAVDSCFYAAIARTVNSIRQKASGCKASLFRRAVSQDLAECENLDKKIPNRFNWLGVEGGAMLNYAAETRAID
jgi:hypothetical protein